MFIIIIIVIAFVLGYILYKIGQLTAKILSLIIILVLIFAPLSIVFSPTISKLNCYYYSGHYANSAVSELNIINNSMYSGESRESYNEQLSQLRQYIEYSQYSLNLMYFNKDYTQERVNILKDSYNKLIVKDISPKDVSMIISNSEKELSNIG